MKVKKRSTKVNMEGKPKNEKYESENGGKA